MLTEYERVTQIGIFSNALPAALMSGRKYGVVTHNGHCSRESNVRTLVFRKKSPLPKRNVVTELNMENIHLQIKQFAAIETVTPQMLKNTWREIGHLTS
jgi:hypothetical protein